MKAAGVPGHVVDGKKRVLDNMLGLVRGNVYYNLMNWYRCLICLPIGDASKFMDTMMGKSLLEEQLCNKAKHCTLGLHFVASIEKTGLIFLDTHTLKSKLLVMLGFCVSSAIY